MQEEQDIINRYRGVSPNDAKENNEEPAEEQAIEPAKETEITEEEKVIEVESVEKPEEKNSEDKKELKNNSSPHVEQRL